VDEHTERTEVAAVEGPPPGTILLDKYRVDWMLGKGGYGYVVKAHHLELGESVAIKILRDDREVDQQTLGRFFREARAVVRLKSEHVARVHDVGKLPSGAPYIVMELLEGEDLGKTLEKAGALNATRAVNYVLEVCEALAEAHSIGIIHRDIKPSNLFLTHRRHGPSTIKVVDFGISKARRDEEIGMKLTQTQSVLGTPAYMSPEQMRSAHTVDARADIWALGAVLYELVEGYLPFQADNFAELCVIVATEQPRPMQLAPELRDVIERCLAKTIDDRYANVAELANAIAPFATPDIASEYVARIHRLLDLPMSAGPPMAPAMLRFDVAATPASFTDAVTIAKRPRGRALSIVLLLVLVAAAGAVALLVFTGGAKEPVGEPAADRPVPRSVANDPAKLDAPKPTAIMKPAPPSTVEPATPVSVETPATGQPSKPDKRPAIQVQRPTKKPASSGSGAPVKKKCNPEQSMIGC
jgi:serine/threonine-protein kinase